MKLNLWIVLGIVALTTVLVKLEGYFENRKSRKIQAYTLMTMMNDLAELATKCGYPGWIDYLTATYGEQNAILYITQIYNALYRSRIRGEQIDAVKAALKKYLRAHPVSTQEQKEKSSDRRTPGLDNLKRAWAEQKNNTEVPLGLQFLPKKKDKNKTDPSAK